jgi:hypothetical protein
VLECANIAYAGPAGILAPSMDFQVIAEVGIQNDSSHPTRRILEAGLTEKREVLLAGRGPRR